MFFLPLLLSFTFSKPEKDEVNMSQPAILRRKHDLEHFECFSIVKFTHKHLLAGKESKDIAAILKERCTSDKLPKYRQEICNTISETKLDEIIKFLNDKKHPQAICNAIGYRRRHAEDAQISQSSCVELVEKFRTQFKNFDPNKIRRPFFNSTRWGIFRKLQQPANETATPQTAKLLESETKSTQNTKPFGLHPENAISDVKLRYFHNRIPFGLAPLCKELPENNRLACHIISRNVYKQYTQKINQTAEEICVSLNATNLIRFN